MTTITRTKNKSSLAPDILGKSQNWIQKVSSLRLSNIRVGYQLTSLIGEKEMKSHDLFIPLFVKIVSYQDIYYVLLGGVSGLRICRIIDASNNSDVSIELLYEDTNISCIDCCIYDPTRSQLTFAILYSGHQSDDTHFIRIISLDEGPKTLVDHEFEGVPERISSTNSFLLVAVSPGSLRIFFGESMTPITEIPSVFYRPIVYAVAPRWIAIQVPQREIGTAAATNAIISHNPSQQVEDGFEETTTSSGDAARRVVSGLYTLSKLSWQAVQPYLSHNYSTNHQSTSRPSKYSPPTISHRQPEIGGGILVLDLESYQNSHGTDRKDLGDQKLLDHVQRSETLPVITHFVSHPGESLSVMAFSPTGLKLASVDTHGQVILVHALVPCGLTSHSHQVVGLLSTNRPYLLYKLVRGLTLAKIVEIGFDNSESIAFASSSNGTVHIFDLNSTTTESNEIKSTPSSWQDAGTSPLNPLNLLGINGFSGSHPTNGHTYYHSSPRSHTEDQVPLMNVSQFLQLHKPDLRTLHGYSEMKIKLPLRESPLHETHQSGLKKDDTSTQDEGDLHRDRLSSDSESQIPPASTSFFHEVNMNSCTVFLPYQNFFGTESKMDSAFGGKFEILIGSSEGIVSRYQLIQKSVNGNQVTPNSLRELNRWDLCSPLVTAVPVTTQIVHHPSHSSTSWITAVGSRIDHIVDIPPVWMRPQCSLRKFRLENGRNLSHSYIEKSLSNSPASTSLPIPIENSSTVGSRKKKNETQTGSARKHPNSSTSQDSSPKSEEGDESKKLTDKQMFFFPERLSTSLLKVDRNNLSSNSNSDIGEKIHSALASILPEIPNPNNVIITKRVDDITAWELDEDWEGT